MAIEQKDKKNNLSTDIKKNGFTFTEENMTLIRGYISHYPEGRQASAVKSALYLAQRQNGGWLSHPAIEEVARVLDMPFIRVYEVVTFYTRFNEKPIGKYHVQVCGTTPCWLNGADSIKETCRQKMGIEPGDVSVDGLFSWGETECLGACVRGPVLQINANLFGDLTPEKFKKIIDDLKSNKPLMSVYKELEDHHHLNSPASARLTMESTDAI